MLIHITNITRDILHYKEKCNSFLLFTVEFSFLKMPAIRHTNLSHRTRNAASQRYARANQTYEQRKAWNEVEQSRWNQNQKHRNVAFNP